MSVPIALGQAGLHTDDPMMQIPPNAAVLATNLTMFRSRVEKSGGSAPYNTTALPAPIVGIYDWFPSPSTQVLIALTSTGNIYRDSGDQTFTSNTAFVFTEVQTIKLGAVPENGSFQLEVNTTSLTVAYTASNPAAALQTQIRAVSGYGSVVVTGNYTLGFTVTMTGVTSPPLMTTTTTSTESVTNLAVTWPSTTTLFTYDVQRIKFSVIPTGGTFALTYNSATSGNFYPSSTSDQIQTELRKLPGLSAVTVDGDYTTGLIITINQLATVTPLLLTVGANALTPTTTIQIAPTPVTVTVARTSAGKANLGTLTPDVHLVQGGAEVANNNRKLFIFTGGNQVQVLNGNGTKTADIQQPAADWATSFPTFGIIYNGRLFAFGNSSSPHMLYISSLSDHENFLTPATPGTITPSDPQFYPIFPGVGDALVGAAIYKGTLLLFKRPYGVYAFNWADTTQAPAITQYTDTFGIASPHAAVGVLNDLIGYSNSGSLFSMTGVQAFGDFETGDVLNNTKTRDYYRNELDPIGLPATQCVYYPEKQVAYFTARDVSNSAQNRMIVMDVSSQTPKMMLEDKDQPTCLALRRDNSKILRPMYGANDGFVYLMDQTTHAVGANPYVGQYQTPNMDFAFVDQSLGEKNKIFDFLSINYEASGNWNFYVDVAIDGNHIETLTFTQNQGNVLDSFVLDVDKLGNVKLKQVRKRLHATGKTISFRIYNNNLNEYFKVDKLVVDFRVSAEQAQSSKS